MKQGLLEQNMFSFYMTTNPSEQSELVFGTYDADKFTGEITWHSVVDKFFWSLKLDDIKINGKSLGFCKDKNCMVTPDSGTSLIVVPTWAFKEIEP